MKTIEEKLWNYIDGTMPTDERKAIALLIEHDKVYFAKYQQLLQLNKDFAALELDEPSMAFTFNVMHAIREEYAVHPLKSSIDKRVIWAITSFFILTITVLLVYSFSTANWATGDSLTLLPKLNVTKVNSIFSGYVVKAFLFFDLVIGLFLTDYYLRRKTLTKHH
jgi:hypothetical protein